MQLETRIAQHLNTIPRSGIRDFFEIVQTMTDVVSLGIGEPDFVTPWHIREAAIYALEKGRTGYTSNLGLPKLRRAISTYLSARFALDYNPHSEILVAVGVSQALDAALRAIIDPGDEILYHEPCYVSYNPSIALAHGVAVPIRTREEEDFRLSPDALRANITPRTKAILLNFPTNPTGAAMGHDGLADIAEVCLEHDLLVLTDEIYGELVYDGFRTESIATLPGMRERTIYFNGFSKAYAMTGFRVGYACAPAPLIEAMMKIHQYGILCAPNVSQEAAIEAMESGASDAEKMRAEYELRRNYIVSCLNEMGLPCRKPAGSFYVFPRITPTGLTSTEFSLGLLEKKRVAVVPGPAFGPGGEGYVRCSFATGMSQIKIAMERMAEFVADTGAAASGGRTSV